MTSTEQHSEAESLVSQTHITFFLFYIFSLVLSLIFHKLNYPFLKDNHKKGKEKTKGLRERLLESQPSIRQEHHKEGSHTNTTCPICFEELSTSTSILLPKCFHSYHERCLGKWVDMKSTCPCCRSDISKNLAHVKLSFLAKVKSKVNTWIYRPLVNFNF